MDKETFLRKLEQKQPSNFKFYSYGSIPSTFQCADKIPIDCLRHGVFYQKASSHLFGSGCQECWQSRKANSTALTTLDFINKSKSRFGNRFDYSKTKYTRGNVELMMGCPLHGEITLKPDQHLAIKHGCLDCSFELPRKTKKDKILKKAKAIHNDKYDYSRVVFVNGNDKVEIVCPVHGSFWQALYLHTAKSVGCPSCAREDDKLSLSEFILRSHALHGNRYDYGKVDYVNGLTSITITCKKHGDFNQRASSHLDGSGCRSCHIEKNRLTTEEFIRDARTVHGESYDYSKVIYTGNKTPVEIICSVHGSFWQKPNSHVSSRTGCRLCYESKGEKAVERVLEKYGINKIREHRIKPHLYRYDFYLPDFNVYIEFHGIQHYKAVETFGGEKAFLSLRERDENKQLLVEQQGSRLIVLNYLSLIRNTVEKNLIVELKKIYKYWFIVDGQIKVFRTLLEVYSLFDIPLSIRTKDLVTEVGKKIKDFRVLF